MADKLVGKLSAPASITGRLSSGVTRVVINDHNQLDNRDLDDQHPISAITGLQDALNSIPSKTSDITNDGDGESPFATQEYVEQNGGKIDVIELNGVEQEIVNKKVSLDVDKQTIGLGNVDNTSDLNKPISTTTQNALDGKVDKVNGKGLSTNDYTDEEKLKLSGIEAGAEANVQSDWNSTGGDDFIKNKPTSLSQFSNIETNFQNANQVATAISDNNTNVVIPISERVNAIESKIPNEATSNNKLTDRDFVNSSIATNTATFRGNYNLINDLSLTIDATEQEIALALSSTILTSDNNDYCFVRIPTSDLTPTQIARIDRYKYNGTNWSYEYSLNNSGFTAAQWAAINSGATDTLIGQISTNQSNISNLNTNKVDNTTTIAGVDLQDNITASELRTALNVSDGAQVNTIDSISAGGTALTIDANKNVDIPLIGASINGSAGVVKTSESYGTTSGAGFGGIIAGAVRTYEQYKSDTNRLILSKGTLENVIDGKGFVERLTGSTAPTTSTACSRVGCLYLDTTNNKTYQCVAINEDTSTTPSTFTYTWVKLIRVTDRADQTTFGVVKVWGAYGTQIVGDSIGINPASESRITNRTSSDNRYCPITPANLNFAVKSSLTDANHLTMTSNEQTTAQSVIGASSRGIARL